MKFLNRNLIVCLSVICAFASSALAGDSLAVRSEVAPYLNGTAVGDVQVNRPGFLFLDRRLSLQGDLLLRGTPDVRFWRGATPVPVVEGQGSSRPEGYRVIVNRGSSLSSIVNRTDPVDLPGVLLHLLRPTVTVGLFCFTPMTIPAIFRPSAI